MNVLLCLLSLLLLLPAPASAARWEVEQDGKENEIVFHSKATMESFEGKTDAVAGWIDWEGPDSDAGMAWEISVELATLDTGIGLRNTHMRENHLHTDEHPLAVFRGRREGALPPLPATVELEGDFVLHGVTVARAIPVQLELDPGGALRARAEFMVSLADHEIPRPKFLMLKLADEQRVEVRLIARRRDGGG